MDFSPLFRHFIPSKKPVQKKIKKILCVDFDGVIHSYRSGWRGLEIIADPPVPGAMEFLAQAVEEFEVHIFSSRNEYSEAIEAMRRWLLINLVGALDVPTALRVLDALHFPTSKPPAHVIIDDRAVAFKGIFPSVDELRDFKPWSFAM